LLVRQGYKFSGDLSAMTPLQVKFLKALENEERVQDNIKVQELLRKKLDHML